MRKNSSATKPTTPAMMTATTIMLHVAVADVGQLVAEHRFHLRVVELLHQAGGDGDGILLRFRPVAKALSASVSIILSLGIGMPREMQRFSSRL